MAAKKKHKVGEILEVPQDAQVTRPDGSTITVAGGAYVLDVPGAHTVNGESFEVA